MVTLTGLIIFTVLMILLVSTPSFSYAQTSHQNATINDQYMLKIQTRDFIPTTGLEIESIAEDMSQSSQVYFLMQFEILPDADKRKELDAQGIQLVNYLGANTYIVSSLVSNLNAVEEVSDLQSAIPFNPVDKISLDLQGGKIGDWAFQKPVPQVLDGTEIIVAEEIVENKAVLTIHFHKNVLIDDAKNVVESNGGEIISAIPIIPSVTALVDLNELENISRETIVQFIDVVDPPLQPTNDNAKVAAKVMSLPELPYSLTGQGVTALVYDHGVVDPRHPDFTGRILQSDVGTGIGQHATHVAGTLGGNGANSDGFDSNNNLNGGTSNKWTGMAPQIEFSTFGLQNSADLLYDSGGDLFDDFTLAINSGVDLATMSLGNPVGRLGVCDKEGDYTSTSILIDNIVLGAINNQQLIFLKSEGNERGYQCVSSVVNPIGPYGTTNPPATSKNAIVVGATYSNNDLIATFSGYGPTDDGRIKPDIVAPGCQNNFGSDQSITSPTFEDLPSPSIPGGDGIWQSGETFNTYVGMCGTSMATPLTAGVVGLLIEEWRQTHASDRPLPHSVKAILIHTATDEGREGPDYQYGWGLLDAKAAIDLVIADETDGLIIVDQLDNGQTDTFTFDSNGVDDVKVTLVWDDPAAPRLATTTLMNNLDLRLHDPDNIVYQPFILDPNNPSLTAISGDDATNNVEMIIGNAKQGTWIVTIDGSSVSLGPQQYTLVTSSSPSSAPIDPPQNIVTTPFQTEVELSWDAPTNTGGSTIIGYDIAKQSPLGQTILNQSSSPLLDQGLTPDTSYTYKIKTVTSLGSSDFSSPITVTTLPSTSPSDFSLVPSSTLKIDKDQTKSVAIGIDSTGSYSGSINFQASSLSPSDLEVVDITSSRNIDPNTTNPSTTLIVESIGDTGTYVVSITGDDGTITHSVEQQVEVGGCLIATAAFGSELAPQVQMLREIRDTQLLQTESGESFMQNFNAFYYTFSPTVAQWERDSPIFKEIVKTTITPLITSLSILKHVDINSESEMLFYGISLIMLNISMYFVAPGVVIFKLRNKFSN